MTNLSHKPDWPADRVAEARAVIADAAHHSDRLVTIACEVLARHGATDEEREEARLLRLIVDARRPVRGRRNDDDHDTCGVQP
ncbi:hypothetical protein [Paracoccus aerodenitrificans]|uniref:hypothetical protein n=1 Tax=Paracoccus aerodenitrificans TaxID=3017781 RepID=UPI0022F0C15F|nr:hypothetical protein [Paracoccus aerodenitrificans]WBU64809.1 hypothetical protein PAE61_05055 [Paracoccus aerodenitrificans]